ncbi:MAG: D-hexose-6-phosphate mutarotase [Ardenticatenaceae bacterium]|nr:D-hexose-6-phosphate mutarotase [Ardenticatenaceae bacterium]
MPDELAALNRDHAIPNEAEIVLGNGQLPKIKVQNQFAAAEIYLHGAHLTRYERPDEHPLLWLSPQAVYQPGKAIRGGVPLVWPWFGPHPTDPSKPQHGLARVSTWEIKHIEPLRDGATEVVLTLGDSDASRTLWPHRFSLKMSFVIGRTLHMSLTTTNLDVHTVTVGCALHTYFSISHVAQVSIQGLDGKRYLDQLDDMKIKNQEGALRINQEVDRIYLESGGVLSLFDQAWNRKIKLTTDPQVSNSTIVWNPWIDKAAKMADFDDEGYQHMVCIETANAADDVRSIEPGERHTLTVKIE